METYATNEDGKCCSSQVAAEQSLSKGEEALAQAGVLQEWAVVQ